MTKVLVLAPLTAPQSYDAPADAVWASCQKIVDGYIEICYGLFASHGGPLDESRDVDGYHLACYANEDGISLGLPLSRVWTDEVGIFGTCVITRERVDDQGNTHYRSITQEDIAKVTALDMVATLRSLRILPIDLRPDGET